MAEVPRLLEARYQRRQGTSLTARDLRFGRIAAALLALLMLSFASVQSDVMQAVMAFSGDAGSLCGASAEASMATPGMAMAAASASKPHRRAPAGRHGRKASCPYCAAAAHPPIMTSTPLLRPSALAVFAAFRVVASRGPHGPPAVQPRARGPPVVSLT